LAKEKPLGKNSTTALDILGSNKRKRKSKKRCLTEEKKNRSDAVSDGFSRIGSRGGNGKTRVANF